MIPFPPALLTTSEAPAAALQAWIGKDLEAEPFGAFARARRADITAGAREPYRSWLLELMGKQTNHLRAWAATRLVEAGAEVPKDGPSPNGYLLAACAERFQRAVIWGNGTRDHEDTVREDPPEAWRALGAVGEPARGAPCWSLWRSQLVQLPDPAIRLGFYALFAPALEPEDGPWVRRALVAVTGKPPEVDPLMNLAFLLATDWLMLYGHGAEWTDFQEALPEGPWRKAVAGLAKEVRKLPLYWSEEAGTEEPVTRGAKGPALRRTTFLIPDYPAKAARLQFSTTTTVEVRVDVQGRAAGLRLRPGYALAVFGPPAMSWVGRWTYDPATLDGVPVAARFLGTVRFIRGR